MSRRIKVLIACLVAILLSVPLGYVWIAWRPVEPLSFRIIGERKVQELRGFGPTGPGWSYEVEIHNSSASTILLSYASVQVIADGHSFRDKLGYLDLDTRITVPAHTTIRGHILVYEDTPVDISVEGAEVHYQWRSSIRDRMTRLKNDLMLCLHLMNPGEAVSKLDENSSPLQWSSTIPRPRIQPKAPTPQTIQVTP